MTSVNATQARKELFALIRRAIRRHEPVSIRHPDGGVVLVSEDDYAGLIETLELLAEPGFREALCEAEADVKAGRTHSAPSVLGDA